MAENAAPLGHRDDEQPRSAEVATGGEVADYWDLPEAGQIHRSTGATVKTIVLRTPACWVFLDENQTTWWACSNLPSGNESVLNRVAVLESIPIDSLTTENRTTFRGLVAEGVARMLQSGDVAAAHAIHQAAEDYVRARLSEVARSWYLRAALQAMLIAFALMGFVGVMPPDFAGGYDQARTILLCLGCGAIGAGSSLISRIGSFPLDPSAGKSLHQQEAIARIVAGIVGALVAYLTVRAGIILPNLGGGNQPALLVLAFVAGASERFVPSIVERIEATAGQQKANS